MKLFTLGLLAASVASKCDITCMHSCWDNYQGPQTFTQNNCLSTTCGCSDYVATSLGGLVDTIQADVLF